MTVLRDGLVIAAVGVVIGGIGGVAATRLAASYVEQLQVPGALPVLAATLVLVAAVLVGALVPAARAARVDVMQALRTD
jgi:ABC-type antimicrobial peptide transport system permease subunit